jgi:hypothetical protein
LRQEAGVVARPAGTPKTSALRLGPERGTTIPIASRHKLVTIDPLTTYPLTKTWRSGSLKGTLIVPSEAILTMPFHPAIARCLFSLAMVLPGAAVFGATAAATPQPVITAGARTITISGVTPGGTVVLFGASHETREGNPPIPRNVRRAELLVDTDGDGSVVYDVGGAVPAIAVWIAVDLTTGAHGGGPLTDFPGAPAAPISTAAFLRSNPGALNKLSLPFAELALLVVRPKVGAWQAYAAKHSARDENRGTTKQLQLDLASAIQPLGDNKVTLGVPQPGDVVVAIDPRGLSYAVVEVSR